MLEVFGEIVSGVPRENALIIPSNLNAVQDQKIRVASFIVIVSSVIDIVGFEV